MEYLNELINIAQTILDTGFDAQAFLRWEAAAFLALLTLLGPFHYYTRNFKRLTSENGAVGLLAGEGILIAAREEILKASSQLQMEEQHAQSAIPPLSLWDL